MDMIVCLFLQYMQHIFVQNVFLISNHPDITISLNAIILLIGKSKPNIQHFQFPWKKVITHYFQV